MAEWKTRKISLPRREESGKSPAVQADTGKTPRAGGKNARQDKRKSGEDRHGSGDNDAPVNVN
jgi:hypothetical protein